jgi:TP901 family phage tail tape measure protein
MSFRIDELFYELDARTEGFESKILHGQTSLDNFAKFVREKPMLATAAFAASILAIGVAAVKMADEVDVNIRKVVAAFPEASKQVEFLRQSVEDLSEITPRSQAELSAAAAKIAERGVQSVAEIQQRLKTAVDFADATGTDLISVVEALDTVGDQFGLTANQAADALTRIYGAAQGKVALQDVFTVLERGGSVLHALGVEAADAGEAMVALVDAGVPRRQAGTVLTTILELTNRVRQLKAAGGEQAQVGKIIEATLSRQNVEAKGLAGALGEFADRVEKAGLDLGEYGIRANTVNAVQRVAAAAAKDTRSEVEKLTDAQNKLQAAAATNRESASALATIFRNELSESLIRLGNELLPTAIKMIDGLTDAFRRLHGEGNPLKEIPLLAGKLPTAGRLDATSTLGSLGLRGYGEFFRGPSEDSRSADSFYSAIDDMSKRVQKYGTDALSGVKIDDLKKITANLDELFKRDPSKFTDGMHALALAVREATKEAETADKPDKPTKGPPTTPAALTNEVRNAIDALKRSVDSTVASQTQTQIDDAQEKVRAFREEVRQLEEKAGRKLPELEARGKALEDAALEVQARERTAAAKGVAQEVAQALGLQSRIMEQGLKDFLADVDKRNQEYRKLGLAPLFTPEQIQQVKDVRQALIDATAAAERADAAITAARAKAQPEGGGRPDLVGAARGINESIAAISAERDATATDTAGLEKRRRLQAEINKLQQELNSLRAQNDALLDKETQILVQHTKHLQDQAAALNQAVGLALQLGQAFGIVDAKTANILQSVVSAAAGIGPFLDQLHNFREGTKDAQGNPLATIGSVIGAAAPIIGGVTAIAGLLGFGGPSPEELERRRLLKENNERLAELNDSVGDLARINITGAEYGKYSQFLSQPGLQQIGPQFGQFTPDQINRAIGAFLDAAGISSKQLEAFAQSFGITVGTGPGGKITLQDLDNLRKAMQSSELTQFATTFTGQMQEMDAAIRLFDLKDPIKQLEAFRKAIDNVKNGGGILQATIDKFDTSTAEGLAAAQAAIQDLFRKLQEGSLKPEDLGGLTAQEFLDALLKEADLLKAAQAGSGPLGTGGFNVSQQITETTGSRLAAIADTSRIFLQQIAENTAQIAVALGGHAALPPITPPDTTPGFGATTVAGDTYNITIELNGPIYGSKPEEIGERIGDSLIARIDTGLGRKAKVRAITAGKTLTV